MGAATPARTTACIGSSKHGAMNASEFRSKPMCDELCAWRSLPVRQDTVTTVARVRRDAADCGGVKNSAVRVRSALPRTRRCVGATPFTDQDLKDIVVCPRPSAKDARGH